jgi:hypothetical protein
MIWAVVGVAVLFLVIALVVAVAREQGPPPGDVALAYELAWDRLDFEALWNLSGDELRDGLGRKDFVVAKRAAYRAQPRLGNLAEDVSVREVAVKGESAVARTDVALREGGSVTNRIELARRASHWVVVAYRMEPGRAPSPYPSAHPSPHPHAT